MHPLLLQALIGAAIGGGSAWMQRRDPLKGALLGGGSSLLAGGIGSLFSPQAAAAKEAAMTGSKVFAGPGSYKAAIGTAPNIGLGTLKNTTASSLKDKLFSEKFKKALTGGFPADKLGAYKYGIVPAAAAAGEFLLNPRDEQNPTKGYRPPLNVFYGRNPGRFGFGDWFDEDKIKQIYTDREDPYYYPEGFRRGGTVSPNPNAARGDWTNAFFNRGSGFGGMFGGRPSPHLPDEDKEDWMEYFLDMKGRGPFGGGIASLKPHYQEGGDVDGSSMGAMAQQVSAYLAEQGVEPTMENVQDVIEQILEDQQRTYEPLTGIGGQLQQMTQQYATPMGEEMQEERPQMNMGGNPRRYYQEGGMGAPMLPTGDLDMRPGGEPVGPGTGTSDDIPAMLSDGEFVMTAQAVEGAGGGDRGLGSERMMNMMRNFEQGGQPSAESQGLGSMEETTMTEMVGPEGMMMEGAMMEGAI